MISSHELPTSPSAHELWPERAFPLSETREWVAAKLDLPTSIEIEPTAIYASYTQAPDLRLTARLALKHTTLPRRSVVLKVNRFSLLPDSARAHALVSRHASLAVPHVLAWEEHSDGSSHLLYEPFEGRPISDDETSLIRTAEAIAFVQRAVADSGEAHSSGISCIRAEDIPAVFERVFSHIEAHLGAWETDEEGKLSACLRAPASEVLDILTAARPQIRECSAVVSALDLPITIDHGDLHEGNARLLEDGSILIYDWETATVGCPIFSLEKLIVSAWRHDKRPEGNGPWGYRPGTPTQARVRDAYLLAWGRTDIDARSFAAALSLAVVKEMGAEIDWANVMGWPNGNPEWTAQLLSRMQYHLQSI